jgi:hypothetical protein
VQIEQEHPTGALFFMQLGSGVTLTNGVQEIIYLQNQNN